jgi:hypothetical protein
MVNASGAVAWLTCIEVMIGRLYSVKLPSEERADPKSDRCLIGWRPACASRHPY